MREAPQIVVSPSLLAWEVYSGVVDKSGIVDYTAFAFLGYNRDAMIQSEPEPSRADTHYEYSRRVSHVRRLVGGMMKILTTNEIDKITGEERRHLMGYCDTCDVWTPFIRGADKEVCEGCGGNFSSQIGQQLTTQRTFNPIRGKRRAKQLKISA